MGPFLCNEPSVPTKDRVWGDERSNFGECPSPDGFAPNREPAPLVVSQSESPAPELLLENTILFAEIFDNSVLLAPDPARECGHKNLPRLENPRHPQIVAGRTTDRQLSTCSPSG